MKVRMTTSPTIGSILAKELTAGERASTLTFKQVSVDLKNDWRGQITRAGLGRRLANSIRSKSYPQRGASLNAAALVWSKAAKIISAHDEGALIKSKNNFFLAIPTEAAGKGRRGAKLTPEQWEQQRGIKLRFIYRRNQPSLLVAEARLSSRGQALKSRSKTGRNVATVPIFILLPQVKLSKRLNLARDAVRAARSIPDRLAKNWKEID